MIFVVEQPEGAAPRAWFAFDIEDLELKLAGSVAHDGTYVEQCSAYAEC